MFGLEVNDSETGLVIAVLEESGFDASELASDLDLVEACLLGCYGWNPVYDGLEYESGFDPVVMVDDIDIDGLVGDIGRCELEVVVHGVIVGQEYDFARGVEGDIAGGVERIKEAAQA